MLATVVRRSKPEAPSAVQLIKGGGSGGSSGSSSSGGGGGAGDGGPPSADDVSASAARQAASLDLLAPLALKGRVATLLDKLLAADMDASVFRPCFAVGAFCNCFMDLGPLHGTGLGGCSSVDHGDGECVPCD